MRSILLALLISIPLFFPHGEKVKANTGWNHIKSGNVDPANINNAEKIIQDAKKLGLNTINVPVIVHISSTKANDITIKKEELEKTKKLIQTVKKEGFQVVLEPFPWIQQGDVGETSWDPTNKKLWFQNWEKKVLLPISKEIATPYDVKGMKIASNFVNMEHMEKEWNSVIQNVRKEYKGNLLYQINWWYTDPYNDATFDRFSKILRLSYLKKVDVISIDTWFELSDKRSPSLHEIKQSFTKTHVYNRNQNVVKELKTLANTFKKPIYFGGWNVPARSYALKEPWNNEVSKEFNPTIQYNGMKAYLDILGNEKWFSGFSIWHIGGNEKNDSYRIDDKRTINLLKTW